MHTNFYCVVFLISLISNAGTKIDVLKFIFNVNTD